MESMVEELLNNVRIRPICFEVASLNKTIECVFQIADIQNRIAANDHKQSVFKLDLPDEPIIIPHDSSEIEGVILNLILNAKANIEDGNGRIEIRLSKETNAENSVALIEVTDNGRGIPPESLSKIFTPFYTTCKDGTGLGLAAVQRIVEAHNGSCEVFSEVGRGTSFQIRLPIR
ncbi:MAG: sensor histidine kinase [Aridibacter sp.]